MKSKPNQAVKALRTIIQHTQSQFAAMVGTTRDAVASWECGRNRLSRKFAARIFHCTGAWPEDLVKGRRTPRPVGNNRPYERSDFESFQAGDASSANAMRFTRAGSSALEVLLFAACKPGLGRLRNRMPAVYESFLGWCDQTCEEFKLRKQVDEVLAQRKIRDRRIVTWGDCRRQNGVMQRILKECYGFEDNKRMADAEELTLEFETSPAWVPGCDMGGGDRTTRGLSFAVGDLLTMARRADERSKRKPAVRKLTRRGCESVRLGA